jgi:prolyl-tRNA synthetase
MGLFFTDEQGRKRIPYFGSYGIGVTRLIGTIVELHHDKKGIIWPESVAPYQIYLIVIGDKAKDEAEKLYETLREENVEVLYDDRADKGPGEKFADADLIGIPNRIVISEKTLAKGMDMVEIKKRSEEKSEIISAQKINEVIKVE